MKRGDIVVVLEGDEPYYKKGDKAKLLRTALLGDWLADFTINDEYFLDGIWHVDVCNFVAHKQ
jgi:hypothetical protein